MNTHHTSPTADDLSVRSLPTTPQTPFRPATSRNDGRQPVLVLTARRARDREPAATCWRLTADDPATGVAVADLAGRWEPATLTPVARPFPDRVHQWLTDTLGHPVAIGPEAHQIAGPCSWHVDTASPGTRQRTAPTQDGART